jgi:hypothetical protein
VKISTKWLKIMSIVRRYLPKITKNKWEFAGLTLENTVAEDMLEILRTQEKV